MRHFVRYLLILLSVAAGATFLYSAQTKVLPMQPFEYTIVEYLHLPWGAAAVLARLLVGAEAALGGLMVLHIFGRRKEVLKIAAGMLILFSIYLVWLWATAGNDVNCGCFGDEIWMSPAVSLAKNAALLLILFALIRWHKGLSFSHEGFVASSLFLATLALPFFLFPMALGEPDWLKKAGYKLEAAPLYNPIDDSTVTITVPYPAVAPVDVTKGKHILAFISPKCPHCAIAARKIAVMERADTSLPFLLIVGGLSSDLTAFWKETRAQNVPWMRLHPDPFINYTGGRFPLIIWVDNGMVVASSTYNTLNLREVRRWLRGEAK